MVVKPKIFRDTINSLFKHEKVYHLVMDNHLGFDELGKITHVKYSKLFTPLGTLILL